MVTVFARLGQSAEIIADKPLAELIDDGVRLAYLDDDNPLRASMVADPIFSRRNTKDNTPAVTHVEIVRGDKLELIVAAKGGGSENKARFTTLNPSASIADWVVETVSDLGAGWCPPGILGIGVGGSAEKAMLLAKRAVLDEINIQELLDNGPSSKEDELRLEIYDRVNRLGIGAQGLGGQTTVVDVKLASFPCHAASKPVALMPQCAANRHIKVVLDGTGPTIPEPPDLSEWPSVDTSADSADLRTIDVDGLTKPAMRDWRLGETLLLSGKILVARDAAHQRLETLVRAGKSLPVQLQNRLIYYVGPVDAVRSEVVGPAGPTTASRMDRYTEMMMGQGVLATIGKAERGPETVALLKKHQSTYLVAVGGAAVLVSKAITGSRIVAFEDLGMEAIREFEVSNMPVTVAVDCNGRSIHQEGPLRWRRTPIEN